jgi:hypothetical protein
MTQPEAAAARHPCAFITHDGSCTNDHCDYPWWTSEAARKTGLAHPCWLHERHLRPGKGNLPWWKRIFR